MDGAKSFQVAVVQKNLIDHTDFLSPVRKISSLKTEYGYFLAGKACMNQSGIPAVTRPQVFTN